MEIRKIERKDIIEVTTPESSEGLGFIQSIEVAN
jgi:hypothetical protein